MQTPVTTVPQTWLQQIMPYLVMLSITVITALIGVVKVYADKLVAQLKDNKSAAQDAATSAQAASTLAASSALALAAHNQTVTTKLDTIVDQTNGINEALSATIAKQKKEISDFKGD